MASLVAIARALGMPVVLHILFAWAQWVLFLVVVLRAMSWTCSDAGDERYRQSWRGCAVAGDALWTTTVEPTLAPRDPFAAPAPAQLQGNGCSGVEYAEYDFSNCK